MKIFLLMSAFLCCKPVIAMDTNLFSFEELTLIGSGTMVIPFTDDLPATKIEKLKCQAAYFMEEKKYNAINHILEKAKNLGLPIKKIFDEIAQKAFNLPYKTFPLAEELLSKRDEYDDKVIDDFQRSEDFKPYFSFFEENKHKITQDQSKKIRHRFSELLSKIDNDEIRKLQELELAFERPEDDLEVCKKKPEAHREYFKKLSIKDKKARFLRIGEYVKEYPEKVEEFLLQNIRYSEYQFSKEKDLSFSDMFQIVNSIYPNPNSKVCECLLYYTKEKTEQIQVLEKMDKNLNWLGKLFDHHNRPKYEYEVNKPHYENAIQQFEKLNPNSFHFVRILRINFHNFSQYDRKIIEFYIYIFKEHLPKKNYEIVSTKVQELKELLSIKDFAKSEKESLNEILKLFVTHKEDGMRKIQLKPLQITKPLINSLQEDVLDENLEIVHKEGNPDGYEILTHALHYVNDERALRWYGTFKEEPDVRDFIRNKFLRQANSIRFFLIDLENYRIDICKNTKIRESELFYCLKKFPDRKEEILEIGEAQGYDLTTFESRFKELEAKIFPGTTKTPV